MNNNSVLMSYFLIPWTAINLVDYYCLRKGQYRIDDIFDLNGIYGRINRIACGSFLLAIACLLYTSDAADE